MKADGRQRLHQHQFLFAEGSQAQVRGLEALGLGISQPRMQEAGPTANSLKHQMAWKAPSSGHCWLEKWSFHEASSGLCPPSCTGVFYPLFFTSSKLPHFSY